MEVMMIMSEKRTWERLLLGLFGERAEQENGAVPPGLEGIIAAKAVPIEFVEEYGKERRQFLRTLRSVSRFRTNE